MLILIPVFLVTAGMATWSLCLERIHVQGCCVSYVLFMPNGFILEHVCAVRHSDFCTSGFHQEKVSMLFVVLLILLSTTHSFIQPFSTSCFKGQGARHKEKQELGSTTTQRLAPSPHCKEVVGLIPACSMAWRLHVLPEFSWCQSLTGSPASFPSPKTCM